MSNNIPLPTSAYWSRLKFGKKVYPDPLPPHDGEENIRLTIPDNRVVKESNASTTKAKDVAKRSFKVPKTLKDPDKLIIVAEKSLRKDKSVDWDGYPCTVGTDYDQLSISVSKENINRALCFMDSLIKILKSRDFKIDVEHGGTRVSKKRITVNIRLHERHKAIIKEGRYSTRLLIPTGELVFVKDGIYSHRIEWKDGSNRIEDQLRNIVERLEQIVVAEIRENEEYEIRQKIRKEQERIEKEQAKRRQREFDKFITLIREAYQYQQAQILKSYIQAIEINNCQENSEYIEWAKEKADWLNPITHIEDRLLGSFNNLHAELVKKAFGSQGNSSYQNSYGYSSNDYFPGKKEYY